MNTYGYRWRVIIILLSVLYPFFCIVNSGIRGSLSEYWITESQPIFIFANIITAYYFVQLDNWIKPGILLLFVTAFSVDVYPTAHNICAILFFLSVFISLINSKRFKYLPVIYFIGGILMIYNLLIGEVLSILVIGAHHLLTLHKFKSIQDR